MNPNPPLFNCAVDLWGPIKYKNKSKGMFSKIYAELVSLATKVVHLEFVPDLTSEAFINSLKRYFPKFTIR